MGWKKFEPNKSKWGAKLQEMKDKLVQAREELIAQETKKLKGLEQTIALANAMKEKKNGLDR